METASLLNNEQRVITLTEILPSVRQLPATDKLKLIRILMDVKRLSSNKRCLKR